MEEEALWRLESTEAIFKEQPQGLIFKKKTFIMIKMKKKSSNS
jgi:hypothetical protein